MAKKRSVKVTVENPVKVARIQISDTGSGVGISLDRGGLSTAIIIMGLELVKADVLKNGIRKVSNK